MNLQKEISVLVINTNPMCYDGIMSTIFNYAENMERGNMIIDFVAINKLEDSIINRMKKMDSKLYLLPFRRKNPLKYIIQLSKILRKGDYTLVHIHGSSCIMAIELIAAKLANVPACPHSHSTNCQHKWIHFMLKPLFQLLYQNGFACGAEAGHWLYNDKPFEIINNGINTSKFCFNELYRKKYREQYQLNDDDVGIIHIAHFTDVKNHSFLIRVLKQVIDRNEKYKLFLLGQGENQPKIEELVQKYRLQDKVVFVGMTLDVPYFLSACDLMVLPSLYEGFPFTAIEAQASGIKCLVSDKVTQKCCFSNYFEYIKLDEAVWVSKILNSFNGYDRVHLCKVNQKNIIDKGYDIRANADKLKRLYVKYGKS